MRMREQSFEEDKDVMNFAQHDPPIELLKVRLLRLAFTSIYT
jgi:hypothetical protein